ncbi:MAG: hypothetical protein NWS63_05865 [Saprospiraceae bacterium]|jgi:hypothetical protein|nr:hypothetical protein [Saprospiraceae bacterium]MDP4997375.1 hypothetical protein [Saprospiraceae bacterium]
MMKPTAVLILFCWLLLPLSSLQAQFTQILYHTETLDAKDSLVLDFDPTVSMETWASNQVLVETTIRLSKVNTGLLEHLVKSGRYALEVHKGEASLRLAQKPINPLAAPALEQISVKLYIPDSFKPIGEGVWLR